MYFLFKLDQQVNRIFYLLNGVFLFLACALTHSAVGQTTYYVASNGNDQNDGRSTGTAFQTISRVNNLSLQPGDQVLFQRGNTFRGSLQLNRSGSPDRPIVIDAYGNGNKPVLAGSVVVTNWTNIGGNVWQASCPSGGDQVTGLYRDNAALPLGRYPNLSDANKGYLTVQSHAGRTQLTSQQSLATNWTGGEAVFRPVQWILNRARITGQNGNTLNLDGSGTYDVTDNWGYFIQNHPATLDQTGEWYYNPANKTIRLFDNQSNPNNQTVTATVYGQVVNLTNASYVTMRNLQITQSAATGLLATNSSNLVVSGNDITQSAEDALVIQGNGNQLLLENNLIENANNNGVVIGGYQNVTFRGNTVRNIGLTPGRGKSGDGNYVGFQAATTANTMIDNNVLTNIGYNALNFSSSTTVQHNQISNFCVTKSDGSGLYIWNGNQQSMGNIRLLENSVWNGVGASEGSPSGSSSAANGIYLDDCTTNIEVANNSVYNNAGLGIYLHGSSTIRLTGNTSFNNSEGQLAIMSANNCQPRNNVIQNNVFVAKQANQYTVKYESNQNDLGSYGDFTKNVYARPFEDTHVVWAVVNRTSASYFSLAQWKSQYGKDANSTGSPVTYTSGNPDEYIRFVDNPTGNARQVSLEGTYRDARNTVYTGQVTIPAYSSIVLLKDIGQPTTPSPTLRDPENPANSATGLDYGYYEGSWSALPDFGSLTAVKTATSNAPSLSVRNREENFSIRFTGYISVPADGVYTFFTNSDDGSKLLIGNTEVVNNDGGHAEQERSGSIGLKAGVHALTILYFQGGGGQALTVSYSGPSIGKQVIPETAYRRLSTNTPPTTTPPTTPNLRDPENPANPTTGLAYSYYEGGWSALPDFGSLTAVKTGTSNAPILSVRNREENFSIRFTGYISVPADGVYTFFTNSDDGSKLLIGNTEVVNNDGGHAEQERSGSIGLKAGVHALTILYFQGGGGQALTVSYSGQSIGKQVIPEAAYRRLSTTTGGTGTGLRGEYFNNRDLNAPSVLSRIDATINFDWGNGSPATGTINVDNYSVRWTGQIEAPVTGNYQFTTASDDGVRLWVNGNQLINNWTGHAVTTDTGSPIALTAGQKYTIRLEYFEGTGESIAKLMWTYPGQSQQVIPQSRLYPASSSARMAVGGHTEFDPDALVTIYPVPARDECWVRYYAQTSGELTLQLVSTAGVPVMQQTYPVIQGENQLRVPVRALDRGTYIVALIQGSTRITRKILLTE